MNNDINVIWRKGDETMPIHVKCVVEAAQNELVLKSLQLPSGVIDMIRYNAGKNAQTVNEYISAIIIEHIATA